MKLIIPKIPDFKNYFSYFVKKFFHHPLLKDKLSIILILLSFVTNFILWSILIIKIKPTSVDIPVRYTLLKGVELGKWYEVFSLPIVGLFIIVLNLIVCFFIYTKERLASHFLEASSFFIQILILIGGICLVMINIS